MREATPSPHIDGGEIEVSRGRVRSRETAFNQFRELLLKLTGAAVKLWPHGCVKGRLVVGEGVETVLSAALHIKHRGEALDPAWAAIDAGNLGAFPVIAGVQQLIILADNDESETGQISAMHCAKRWARSGRRAELLETKAIGVDFNDIAMGVL